MISITHGQWEKDLGGIELPGCTGSCHLSPLQVRGMIAGMWSHGLACCPLSESLHSDPGGQNVEGEEEEVAIISSVVTRKL